MLPAAKAKTRIKRLTTTSLNLVAATARVDGRVAVPLIFNGEPTFLSDLISISTSLRFYTFR